MLLGLIYISVELAISSCWLLITLLLLELCSDELWDAFPNKPPPSSNSPGTWPSISVPLQRIASSWTLTNKVTWFYWAFADVHRFCLRSKQLFKSLLPCEGLSGCINAFLGGKGGTFAGPISLGTLTKRINMPGSWYNAMGAGSRQCILQWKKCTCGCAWCSQQPKSAERTPILGVFTGSGIPWCMVHGLEYIISNQNLDTSVNQLLSFWGWFYARGG